MMWEVTTVYETPPFDSFAAVVLVPSVCGLRPCAAASLVHHRRAHHSSSTSAGRQPRAVVAPNVEVRHGKNPTADTAHDRNIQLGENAKKCFQNKCVRTRKHTYEHTHTHTRVWRHTNIVGVQYSERTHVLFAVYSFDCLIVWYFLCCNFKYTVLTL